MLTKITSAGLAGTEGYIVRCETDVSDGLPSINMIGQLSSEVRESQDRVRTAIRNIGYELEPAKITINLSPGDLKKTGCGYDLPIAISILCSYGFIRGQKCSKLLQESVFIGELSLGGQLLSVPGVLSLASAARDAGYKKIFVPFDNSEEGGAIDGVECYGIKSLEQMVQILRDECALPEEAEYREPDYSYESERDFSDICGQEEVKRATIIAAAGRHNIIYIGPAGTGKSMIASRIPTIMPKMTKEEQLEVSKIYSISGLLPDHEPLLRNRPFRSPHHTISPNALSGGGTIPKPGEISLASGGVLFLDELAEFKSSTLETLRQPMEEKKVVVSRVHSSIEYPSDFVLVAATNPCKCGYYPDRSKCNCNIIQVRNYLGRISKPILDRIDICVEMGNPEYRDLKGSGCGMKSSEIREEVERVRFIQYERLKTYGILFNSEMSLNLIKEFCKLTKEDDEYAEQMYIKKGMSARGLNKVLKVSRTIADFEGHKDVTRNDIIEAFKYRSLEDKYWGGGASRIESKFAAY